MKKFFLCNISFLMIFSPVFATNHDTSPQIVNAHDPAVQQQIAAQNNEDERIEKLMVSNFANIATNAILAIQTSQQNPENPAATGPFFLNMIQSFLAMVIEAFKTKNINDLSFVEKQLKEWCNNLSKEQLEQILLLVYEQCIDASADFKHVVNGCYEYRN
jgi:hypothetical protein